MSRRRLNPDGTLTILSMSYFGQGDPEEAFKEEIEAVEKYNREVLAVNLFSLPSPNPSSGPPDSREPPPVET